MNVSRKAIEDCGYIVGKSVKAWRAENRNEFKRIARMEASKTQYRKRHFCAWSDMEKHFLINNSGKLPDSKLAAMLDRSIDSIRSYRYHLKVRIHQHKPFVYPTRKAF